MSKNNASSGVVEFFKNNNANIMDAIMHHAGAPMPKNNATSTFSTRHAASIKCEGGTLEIRATRYNNGESEGFDVEITPPGTGSFVIDSGEFYELVDAMLLVSSVMHAEVEK